MQADAVHFAVCDNEQVTEPGTRNHGADGFVKFAIEQAAAADREDLAFLFVVDINLVTCQVYIRVLHGKVYAACFFAAFVIETQGIMAVSFCIGRKDADKAVSAENTQDIIRKLSIGAAGPADKGAPEAEQPPVGDCRVANGNGWCSYGI